MKKPAGNALVSWHLFKTLWAFQRNLYEPLDRKITHARYIKYNKMLCLASLMSELKSSVVSGCPQLFNLSETLMVGFQKHASWLFCGCPVSTVISTSTSNFRHQLVQQTHIYNYFKLTYHSDESLVSICGTKSSSSFHLKNTLLQPQKKGLGRPGTCSAFFYFSKCALWSLLGYDL